MKGALYRGFRRIELADVERPAVGEQDVAIKVTLAGICGSDLHIFNSPGRQPQVVTGQEITGEVVSLGSHVSSLALGDRVVVESLVRCGRCRYCRSGQYNLCDEHRLIGIHLHGGFAEFAVVPAYTCLRLPSSVSNEQAVLVEPLSVAVRGVRAGGVGWGESVVVLGSGTVGLMAIAAARAAGAGIVIATAKYDHQAAAAEDFGATHVVAAAENEANEQIMRLLDRRGADVVIETVGGSASTLQQALQLVRKGGRIAVVGVFGGPQSILPNAFVLREVSLIGAYCYNFSSMRRDFDLAIDLISSRSIDASRTITHVFKLHETQEAFDTAYDKASLAIKVVVEP